MKLLVAIPAFNEEKTIAEVVRSVPQNIPGVDEIEIVVINDGSTDETEREAKKAGADVISHAVNQGLGLVFQRAIHETLARKSDILATIDGDGQFDPREIPQLISPIIHDRVDFATCSRFCDKTLTPNMSFIKKWGNRFLAWLLSHIVKRHLTDVTCGFRAYSREVLLNLNLFGKFTYTHEALLDLLFKNFRLKEIPLNVKGKREHGRSYISSNIFRYGWRTFKIIFRVIRDYKPLRYIGGFGILLFLIGLGCDAFVMQHYLKAGSFTPYKYLGFTGGFLNGIGLLVFILGLVADMLNRIRLTQEKILYFEKKRFYS